MRVKAMLPGTYPLTVVVKYKDQSGVWVEKEEMIKVTVRSLADTAPANGGNNTVPLMVGAVALLAAGYWYFKMRKKPAKPAKL
jgi:LPXTG-motif cell wall-anchored protein